MIEADEFGRVDFKSPGLLAKYRVNTAFLLDYYEHGSGRWSLHGEGMADRWDTSRHAGMLVLPKSDLVTVPFGKSTEAKRLEVRADSARKYLEIYSQWANGEVYECSLEDLGGEELPEWSGGHYGIETMIGCVRSRLKPGDQVKAAGPAAFLLGAGDLPDGVRLVDEFDFEAEEAEAELWAARN